jgi:uncharacterized peroxidase-related enzyme
MSRIPTPTFEEAPVASQTTLDEVRKRIGRISNTFLAVSLSPPALAGLVNIQQQSSRMLDAKTRQRISLAVSQVNGCSYCLSAHTFAALNLTKMMPEDIALARKGRSEDAKADAVTHFAWQVTETRGKVSDKDIAAVRAAGYTDAQIVEIVHVIVQFLYTNFINNVFDTDIDFPVVDIEAA